MGERVKVEAKKPEVKRDNVNSRMQGGENSRPMDMGIERILYLQRTVGNQAVQRLVRSGVLQAKLRIGQPGDMYKQEADRVADAVMRMPEPGVQRQPIEEEEEETIQPKEASTKSPPTRPDIETNIQSSRRGRTPLPKSIRAFFEPRFGHDFSKVKLHTNTQAAELARTEKTPLIQRQENLGEEKEEELIQTKITRDVSPEVTRASSFGIQSLQGGGRPLSRLEQSFFEPRFGADFSNVRVHNDTQAASAAQAVNARAFTHGHNLVFSEFLQQSPRKTPKTNVSLGITGPSIVDHYCAKYVPSDAKKCGIYPAPNITLKAPGVTKGTPIAWSVTKGKGNVKIVGSATKPAVTISGVKKSKTQNDVTIQVKAGKNVATHQLSVLEPTSMTSVTKNSKTTSTFVGTSLHYTVFDQFNDPMGAGICIDETIIECDSPFKPGVLKYDFKDAPTINGMVIDNIFVANSSGIPSGFCVKLDQDTTAGGCGPLLRNIIIIQSTGITVHKGNCKANSSTCP